jgi:hypothetical protein
VSSADAASWRIFPQNTRLSKPSLKVRRYLTDKRLTPLIESIEKVGIPAIGFVKRPSLHTDPIFKCLINQIQRDLGFGLKADVVGNVVFFRRVGSLAQCLGRYIRAATKQ